jgi:hypothetical protein
MERRLGFQHSLTNIKGEIGKRLEQFVEYPGSKECNEWYLTKWVEAKTEKIMNKDGGKEFK